MRAGASRSEQERAGASRSANGRSEQVRERAERAGARTERVQEHERSECDVDSERSELAVNIFYFS